MPHEVIMPALGMTQETGLILSWRKQAGEAVKVGDVLMEVETDKAAMEVEAQADGYLTEICASEGDNVPVGNVVALIADEPGDVSGKEVVREAPAPQADGENVIMPALGMAQDTGLIVVWHKQPGDPVAADDILLEVETDKSVMEIQAGHDGHVAELRAEAGENVPVGSVIAVITAERQDAPVQRKADIAPKLHAKGEEEAPAPQKSKETPSPAKPARPASRVARERVLASPKARRLAAERGLDLARLRSEDVTEPYHVADLDRLASLPARTAASAPAGAFDRIEARVSKAGYAEFREWLASENDARIDDLAIWAAFAAASLRSAVKPDDRSLVVEAQSILNRLPLHFVDPDRAGLASIEVNEDKAAPDLVLRDMTGSAVTAMRLGASSMPSINVTDNENDYEIVMDSPTGMLEPQDAAAVVHEMAARLAEPLRHLL